MNAILPIDSGAVSPWGLILSIVLATLVSEDLTCVAVGLLIAAGRVDWLPGLAGCFAGIVLGDFAVWIIGRAAGLGGMRWQWVRRRLPDETLAEMSQRLCRRVGRAVLVSRFLPGSRVPLFLAAGVLGTCPYRFLSWAFVAALVWTPLLVFAVAIFGAEVAEPLHRIAGSAWVVIVPFVVCGYLVVLWAPRFFTRVNRSKLVASVSRLWRWEFWPAWVFYLPLVPWFLCLAVRYRSFTVWTAANPGITPAGGVVGESKADILAKLPPEWVVPTVLVPPGEADNRLRQVLGAIDNCSWAFPLILKPDVGERGAGVRMVHEPQDIKKYLEANPGPVVVQPFHPGPFEAGIFYYRLPGQERGQIFSITDKVFPVVSGDGQSTLEELIWAHPRYRMQAATFLARHSASVDRVLDADERFALATAGNHCQGTLFRDGDYLVTPELKQVFDSFSRSFNGFFIGRFDVRYANEDSFRHGREFAIVELNGVSSESTNLYDPSWPIWRAYRTLFRQWALLFRIGDANRRRGYRPTTFHDLIVLLRTYYRDHVVNPLAD
jgi:membrane protein DedA with SNARE-associated domain